MVPLTAVPSHIRWSESVNAPLNSDRGAVASVPSGKAMVLAGEITF